MKPFFMTYNDPSERVTYFKLRITDEDLQDAYFETDKITKQMIKECEKSNLISDKFLALQEVMRTFERLESQRSLAKEGGITQ